ncbi:MAG: ankyrin repeat domain-containing protein, partial [Gammaproteobacteria bacterium]
MTNPPQQIRLNGDQGISQEQLTEWADEGSPDVSGRQDGSSSAVIRWEIARLIFEHNSQTTVSEAGYTIPGIPRGRERQALQQLDETVREMKPRGEVRNINVQDRRGHSLVWHAAYNGRVDAIRALANLRANVNTPNNNGATPVYVAAENGHVDAIRALAQLDADVNTPDNYGATPVFVAAENGHVDAIRALADLRANVNTPLNNGAMPVYIAAQNGHVDAIRALADLGADVNTPYD